MRARRRPCGRGAELPRSQGRKEYQIRAYGMVDQCELELPTGRVRVRVPPGGAGVMSAFKDLQQQPLEGLDAPYLHAGELLPA